MESNLNIVLHDAPTPCIARGELLVESVLAATSFFLSSTAFRIPKPSSHCGLFADNAQEVTCVAHTRGEVLFDGDRLLAIDRNVEGPVVRREIEFLVGILPKQPYRCHNRSR